MITGTVQLYRTLPRRFESYETQKGLKVAFEPGADISDLIRHLGIGDENPTAVIYGLISGPDRPLSDGARVSLFQPAGGG